MSPAPAPALLPAILSGTALQRFGRGFSFAFRGLRYLREHPDLWGWVAIPAAINLGFFIFGVISSWLLAPQLLGAVWERPAEGGLLMLWVVTAWIVRFALAAIVGMGVYMVAGLLASPFNEVISEKVEQHELGSAGEPWGWAVFLRDTFWSVVHSLATMVLYVAVMAPLLLLNIIPGIGSAIFTVCSWTVTAFFLAREMLDGSTSRRRMGLAAKLRLVREHKALMGGFGFGTNLLLWIPLVNFVCLPVGVIGATLMYVELERAGVVPGRSGVREG